MSSPQAALPARAGAPARDRWTPLLRLRQVWAGLAIIAMWLAVLFDGIYGGDIVSHGATSGATTAGSTTIPSAAVIALFAMIATIVVARYGFREDKGEPRR